MRDMKKAYKIGLLVLLLAGIFGCITMCRFAKGVKEDTLNKRNEVSTQDSIKINENTYLHKEEIK